MLLVKQHAKFMPVFVSSDPGVPASHLKVGEIASGPSCSVQRPMCHVGHLTIIPAFTNSAQFEDQSIQSIVPNKYLLLFHIFLCMLSGLMSQSLHEGAPFGISILPTQDSIAFP